MRRRPRRHRAKAPAPLQPADVDTFDEIAKSEFQRLVGTLRADASAVALRRAAERSCARALAFLEARRVRVGPDDATPVVGFGGRR